MQVICTWVKYQRSEYHLGQVLPITRVYVEHAVKRFDILNDQQCMPFDGALWKWRLISFKDYYGKCNR